MTATFVPGINHLELASGRYVDLLDPDPAMITLADIAHGLSHICRFSGQCSKLYTVAEHCALVAWRLVRQEYPYEIVLAGLHHDDAEALCVDIPRPLKAMLPEYVVVESRVHAAVVTALGLQGLPFEHPAIKEADGWALRTEAFELLPSRGAGWRGELRAVAGPAPWELGVSSDAARRKYLNYHVNYSSYVGLAA